MANYRLTQRSTWDLRDQANLLLNRTLTVHTIGFPLTYEEVFAVMWDEAANRAYETVKGLGVSMYMDWQIYLRTVVPYPLRAQVVRLQVLDTTHNRRFPAFDHDRGLEINLDKLSEERRAAFYKWLTPAFDWAIKVAAAKRIVQVFLLKHTGNSIGSIATRWPDFAAVPLSMPSPWPERMREAPKHYSPHDWHRASAESRAWYAENEGRMEVVGAMLAQGQMLGPLTDTGGLIGGIKSWSRVDGTEDHP